MDVNIHVRRLIETLREGAGVSVLLASEDDLSDLLRTSWFYRFVHSVETWVTSLFIPRIKAHRQRHAISCVPLASARREAFDLILNLTDAQLKAANLPEQVDGLIDVRFGDLSRGIEGPPGFWESCLALGASGMFALNGHTCVFSGRYKSKRTHSLNAESVQREGLLDLGDMLLRYAQTGALPTVDIDRLPTWRKPRFFDVITYRVRTVFREAREFWRASVRGRHQVFQVGLVRGEWPDVNFSDAFLVPNPTGSYLADPFVAQRDGRTICFAEEFVHRLGRGRIAAIDLDTDPPTLLGTVIEEPCHMSFPYLLEFEGDLYMIPETFEADEISLYRCTSFPMEWERVGALMEDVQASDTMVFPHPDGDITRWWMLTNLRPSGALDFFSRLYLFHADSPLSKDWTPHPLNPVLIDSDGGRNGGLIQTGGLVQTSERVQTGERVQKGERVQQGGRVHGPEGSIYRVEQHQGILRYGKAASVRRIDGLTPDSFHESKIADLPTDLFPGQIGGHHLHSAAGWTAFDILTREQA